MWLENLYHRINLKCEDSQGGWNIARGNLALYVKYTPAKDEDSICVDESLSRTNCDEIIAQKLIKHTFFIILSWDSVDTETGLQPISLLQNVEILQSYFLFRIL